MPTRRQILTATTAYIGINAVFGILAVGTLKTPDIGGRKIPKTIDAEKSMAALEKFLAGGIPDRLLLSQNDHSHTDSYYQLLLSPSFSAFAEKFGYGHIAMEIHQSFQDLAEKNLSPDAFANEMSARYRLAAGVDPAQNIEKYRLRGAFVERMRQSGTKVHFVENQETDLKSFLSELDLLEKLGEGASRILSSQMERKFGLGDRLGQNFKGNILGTLSEKEWEHYVRTLTARQEATLSEIRQTSPNGLEAYDTAVQRRLAHDAILARTIEEKTSGQRCIVYYGDGHGSYPDDLDEKLKGSVKRVTLCADKTAYWVSSQSNAAPPQQMADAYLILESGTLITKEQAIKESAPYLGASALPSAPEKAPRL